MVYICLVTLDINDVDENKRKDFYSELSKKGWSKIPKLTTAWRANFAEGVTRESAINIIVSDIEQAKLTCKTGTVEYAIQASTFGISLGTSSHKP